MSDFPKQQHKVSAAGAGNTKVDSREPVEDTGGFAGKLYGIWFYLVFISTFLLLLPLFALFLINPSTYPIANGLRRAWARMIFLLMGCSWSVEFEEDLDPTGSYIFVSNHSSNLDIPLSALASIGNFRFMAKKEWADIPVFGIFFRTVDMSVDRSSVTSSYRAFQKATKSLEEGMNLVIYPEGTMWANSPLTERFKNGAFRLAIDAGVEVVPVTFLDNWRLYPRGGKKGGRPGRIRAVVHAPISTSGLHSEDASALRDQVRGLIDDTIRRGNSAIIASI